MRHVLCNMAALILASLQITFAQQTNTHNYILSRTYKQAGANENDVSQVAIQLQYFDGLGRPDQQIRVKESPSGTDLVTISEYDQMGRQSRAYLPFLAAGNGAFQFAPVVLQGIWYNTNSAGLQKLAGSDLGNAFTETYFEKGSNRITGQKAPGVRSASSSVVYMANSASEIKRYDYNPATNAISQNGFYASAMLTKVQHTDEQGIFSTEYTDKSGQMVCRQESGTGYTYYVFDNQGLLRAVLQPKFQDDPNFAHYAFLYDYDGRNRLIRKQLPGAGAVETVYDQFDRPALSRDASQLARNVWGFTKYDALNRPVATGEIASADSRATWAANVNAGVQHHENRSNGTIAGYTLNNTAPKNATEANLLTISFYDDYAFSKSAGLAYSPVYYPAPNAAVKGQATGSRTRLLPGNAAPGGFFTSVTYYDAEYRLVQTVRELYDLGANATERVSMQYKFDLAPVVSQQKTEQILAGAVTHTHLATYTYDHADRLLSVKEKVVTGNKSKEVYTVANRYNGLGMLQSQWFHSYNGIKYRRKTNFTYNIRGWQTDAKTVYKPVEGVPDQPFFTLHTSYRNNANYSNGSVDSVAWGGIDQKSFHGGLKFSYDAASRLTGSSGIFGYGNTESGIAYDKNGNILSLSRAGNAVDNLSYQYSGNRLATVSDASGNNSGLKTGSSGYAYDGNGNMTSDGSLNAAITYNYLNLPRTVTIGGGPAQVYDYDATGNKLKFENFSTGEKIRYSGIMQFDGANGLKRIATSGGQATLTPDSLKFDYFLKDHLGNVRVVFNEKGEIIQSTEYYPFGLAIPKDGKTEAERNAVNRFLYNEKELQLGSGYLDYGARMYMPAIGRWGVADPMAEQSRRFSPYVYGYNNPLRFIDPDGRLVSDPQKGILQRIFDFFGIFKKPDSEEQAALYANRQERFDNTVENLDKAADELKSKAEWIPFLGAITDISQGAVKKDNFQLASGVTGLILDSSLGRGDVKKVAHYADYNQARNAAITWLESKGFRAENTVIGKFGPNKGKPIGMSSGDGKIGFRVEYDRRSGAHINVYSGKEKGPHYQFEATEDMVNEIIRRFSN